MSSKVEQHSQVQEDLVPSGAIERTEALKMAEESANLDFEKATLLQDVADLEYDEDFASLVVDQNNLGNILKNKSFNIRDFNLKSI